MFGFIGKFKNEVIAGFDAVHQRLVTLEAKVDALFNHNTVVAQTEEEVKKIETVAADTEKVVEDAKQDA